MCPVLLPSQILIILSMISRGFAMSNDHEMKLTTPNDTHHISNINHKTYIHTALSYKNKAPSYYSL